MITSPHPRPGALFATALALLAVAVGLLVSSLGSASGTGDGIGSEDLLLGTTQAPTKTKEPKVKEPKGEFYISGTGSTLYPGAVETLQVTVTNPHRFDIIVTEITAEVRAAADGCAASNLTVTPYRGSLPVAPLSDEVTTLSMRMAATAPDECQGQRFPLTYGGTAVKKEER